MSDEAKLARIADLTGAIDILLARVKKLRRERLQLKTSLRVKEMHRSNPHFVARLREGRERARQSDASRFNAKKLPDFTPKQRGRYQYLAYKCGLSRDQAVQEVLR